MSMNVFFVILEMRKIKKKTKTLNYYFTKC